MYRLSAQNIKGMFLFSNYEKPTATIMTRPNEGTKIAVMAEQIKNIDKTVNSIEEKLDKNYVSTDKFALTQDKVERLEKIIYGVIMLLLAALVTAGFSLSRK